jgi:hypothetical protein
MKTTAPINCISPSFECHASNGCLRERIRASAADGGRSVLVSAALGLIPLRPLRLGVLELGEQRVGASVTFSMHDPRRKQLAKEGFEVAQILVCKKTRQVAVVSYRYTGVDEQASAPPGADTLPTFSWRRLGGAY